MNSTASIQVHKEFWANTKGYYAAFSEQAEEQGNPMPEVVLTKLDDGNFNQFKKYETYETIILIERNNILDTTLLCLERGYNPVIIASSSMYLLADVANGTNSENAELFRRSNLHTFAATDDDSIVSSKDVYSLKGGVCLMSRLGDPCEPFTFTTMIYIQKNSEVQVKASRREFEASDALELAEAKIHRIFFNALQDGHDTIILDGFYNPTREYPIDSFIDILNECIELYGAYFKLIIIKPVRAVVSKMQHMIRKEADNKIRDAFDNFDEKKDSDEDDSVCLVKSDSDSDIDDPIELDDGEIIIDEIDEDFTPSSSEEEEEELNDYDKLVEDL